ncbi:MAG: hypothetical protein Q9180_003882 [Flavoplaca navasiana]
MNGDLSLSQSLGGLRIANPDDESIPPVNADSNNSPRSLSPTSSSQIATNGTNKSEFPTLPDVASNGPLRASSPLGFDPTTFSTDSAVIEKPNVPPESPSSQAAKERSSYAQRQASRQSIPLTYQDQQQAQFPQYPTMMPITQRHPNASSRPVPAAYTQSPPLSTNGIQSPMESSYRVRNESAPSSSYGMPQRTSSRSASAAMQAGVPSRESSYTDRSYRQGQQGYEINGYPPPRRSSRGMGVGQVANHSNANHGSSVTGTNGASTAGNDDWHERGAAVGVRQELDASGRPILRSVKKGFRDFQFGRTLGEGSYSTVMAATDRETGKEFAIKVLDKRHIIKEKKVKYVNVEKDTLNRLTEHPGVVRLYYTFQDERSLYFVLDLASNGELLGVLKRLTTFDYDCTKFYGAEILDTIDFMHAQGVIHRDLKPENVLLDEHMHVKITDFGTAKLLDPQNELQHADGIPEAAELLEGAEKNKANSFVGTAEYVSPELLRDKTACKASDLWAFGCIIYQLFAGRPPFKAGNEYLTFQKILSLDYAFPTGFPDVAKDLVERLLVLEPSSRLSIEHIKNHQFFEGVKWGRELWKQRPPKLQSFTPGVSTVKPTNGSNGGSSYPPNIAPAHSTCATHYESGTNGSTNAKPTPRLITELPPPSQLDIEWSPVLTKNNERILKLGNLLVSSSPTPHSPGSAQSGEAETPKKFSRFFRSSSPKKQQRLVMVTSSARVIIVASGGEEKKTKTEISLLGAGCLWRKMQDSKGFTYWCLDTKDKHFTFEAPKSVSSDPSTSSASAQEWLDAIERAREMAAFHSTSNSYSSEDAFKELQSGPSSSSRTLDLDSAESRNTLQKPASSESESFMSRKRFSKRQSKSGLSAVF